MPESFMKDKFLLRSTGYRSIASPQRSLRLNDEFDRSRVKSVFSPHPEIRSSRRYRTTILYHRNLRRVCVVNFTRDNRVFSFFKLFSRKIHVHTYDKLDRGKASMFQTKRRTMVRNLFNVNTIGRIHRQTTFMYLLRLIIAYYCRDSKYIHIHI